MSEDTNYLLTDEFVAFSSLVREIHEKKKAKKAELKSVYERIQEEIRVLENEAKEAEVEWQKTKSSLRLDGKQS